MIWLILLTLALLLLYSLLQGAPYVPTKRRDALQAFELLQLSKGSLMVDIGCGDGIILKMAAQKGLKAVGIELNPILWAIASWRCRKYKDVKVLFGNFWHWHLPPETSGVFVFGAGPFMQRLNIWFDNEKNQLGHPFRVVSLGFSLPGRKAVKEEDALLLYEI